MSQLQPVIPVLSHPLGIDAVIQRFQLRLSGCLPWLTHSFGRVIPYNEARGDSWILIPKVMESATSFISVLPNDRFPAMAFWRTDGPEIPVEGPGRWGFTRNLSLTVWVNYNQLQHTRAGSLFPYLEGLKLDVRQSLDRLDGIETWGNCYDATAAEVYEGFPLNDEQAHYITYPYGGFRQELTVRYETAC